MDKKKLWTAIIALLFVIFAGTFIWKSNKSNSKSSNEIKNESTEKNKKVINKGDPIKVSTMNDTEGEILGRMMVIALRNAGYEVEDNTFGYVGTVNGRTALLEGETDIYMDYTGRGLSLIKDVDINLFRDLEEAWVTVSTWDKEHNNLIWLRYAPINNTNAIAVNKDFSEKNNIKTMKDFAQYINNGGKLKLMAQDYWVTLSTGLPGLEKIYGFKLDKSQYVVTESGANNEQLLHEGTDGVNASMVYSTSGLCYAYNQVILEDPEHVSPVYSPAPIIRADILKKYPDIANILNAVFESISQEEMIKMNAEVQVDGKSGMDVALAHLKKENLVK